jgi:superfamily II helicase
MKKLLLPIVALAIFSCGNKEKKVQVVQKQEIKKAETEICYCCKKEYPKNQGYFRYNEGGTWYTFKQTQDLLHVAVGRYTCSPECAMECPVIR